MTTKYANLKPIANDFNMIPGDVAVLKWSHSIVDEPNFVSEYAAIENARSLALDLGSYDGLHQGTMRARSTSTWAPSSRKSLGFAPDVDVLMGPMNVLTMYKATVPEFCIGSGSMPWSAGLLRGGSYDIRWREESSPSDISTWSCPRDATEATTSVFPDSGPASNLPTTGHGVHHGPEAQPAWFQDIFQLLAQEGTVEDEEEGPTIMVSSYFINHQTHRFHDEPRILRFDMEWQEWHNDIKFIWEDLVDNNAPLEVALVRPQPPSFPFRATIATVIVHQHES